MPLKLKILFWIAITWLLAIAYPTYSQDNTVGLAKNTLSFSISHERGFYHRPIYISIQSFFGDSIFYTTDGSLPKLSSNLASDSIYLDYLYDKENELSLIPTSPSEFWQEPQKLVAKAHILRFAAYRNGEPIGPIISHSYFIDSIIQNRYQTPVISIITERENLFDEEKGIYVPGNKFDPSNPLLSGNYYQRGEHWERPIHIEYFEESGHLGFAQDAGIRIHGGVTRKLPQKSLRLYARSEYGNSSFPYPLLPGREETSYKRILLRSTMSTWNGSIFGDVLAHQLIKSSGLDYQEHRVASVFINGEYWGMHTLRDRIDERYISYLHDMDKDSIDMITGGNFHIIAGNNESFLNLMSFVEHNNISIDQNYYYVCSQMDMNNFITYMVLETYLKNYDWPANNVKMWKNQKEGSKWKWIFYDLDAGFGDIDYNMFEHCTRNDEGIIWPNSPKSTLLFRRLLTNPTFVKDFIYIYEKLLHQQFQPDKALSILEEIKLQYITELPKHIERWNFPESMSVWESNIENELVNFITKRPCTIESQIVDFFDLDSFSGICNTHALPDEPLILAPNPNSGITFLYNNQNESCKGNLKIYQINGQLVVQEENIIIDAYSKYYLQLKDLPSQSYILSFQSNDLLKKWKLIINK